MACSRFEVLPVLRRACVGADKAERRVAVVGHELGPGEAGQSGEVAGQALLHLRLQRAVLRVAAGIAVDHDTVACAVAAVAKLRETAAANPQRNRVPRRQLALVAGWMAAH